MDKSIYIPRSAEAKLIGLASNYPAIVVLGPRQTGKTSLVQAIKNQTGKASIYLDLERPRDFDRIADFELFVTEYTDQLIILDEIHQRPGLFTELRGIIDRDRSPGRFILLGSASTELLRGTAESLAGRVGYLDVGGFSLPEISTLAPFTRHWLRGGFPISFLADSEENSTEWRGNFIRAYIERDLPRLGLTADPLQLRRLWTMLAHLASQNINKTKLGQSLDIDVRTLDRYLDYFEQAYLIRRLPPYFTNVGKRLVKSSKIYLRDTGILHELLGITTMSDLLGHPIKGASWENYIVEQIFLLKPRWAACYFYRTQGGAEMDMVITRGGLPEILIEIKHAASPKLGKGFFASAEDLQGKKKFVITPIEVPYQLREDVRVIGPGQISEMFE